jgi:hypothetical protein
VSIKGGGLTFTLEANARLLSDFFFSGCFQHMGMVQQGRAKMLFRFCLGGDLSRLVDQFPVLAS